MYLGIGSLLDLKSALPAQNYPIQNDKNQTSELFQVFSLNQETVFVYSQTLLTHMQIIFEHICLCQPVFGIINKLTFLIQLSERDK